MLHEEHAKVEPIPHSPDQVREPLASPLLSAGGRLVEQQQGWVRHDRPAQLDQLLQAEGQCGYHAVAVARKAQELERLVRARGRLGFLRADPAQAQAITDHTAADDDVLSDQQVL